MGSYKCYRDFLGILGDIGDIWASLQFSTKF